MMMTATTVRVLRLFQPGNVVHWIPAGTKIEFTPAPGRHGTYLVTLADGRTGTAARASVRAATRR